MPITYEDFERVDMRVGRVLEVEAFPEARKPACKLTIDFGPEVGLKRSSAQVAHYAKADLVGRLVVAVVNFPPKRIAGFPSEVLVLGVPTAAAGIALLQPDKEAVVGGRVF
jgi:tRNA-binding protein